MKRDTRILVWLDNEEWSALIRQADSELRHPREQARYLLRSLLLRDQPTDITQLTPLPTGAMPEQI